MGVIWTPKARTQQPRIQTALSAEVADADLAFLPPLRKRLLDGTALTVADVNEASFAEDAFGIYHTETDAGGRAGLNATPKHATGTLTGATLISLQRITDPSVFQGWHRFQSDSTSTHFPYNGVSYFSTFSSSRWLSAATLPSGLDKPHVVVIRANGTERKVWINGVLLGSGTSDSTVQWSTYQLGTAGVSIQCVARTYGLLILPRAVSDGFVKKLQPDNFWQLFAPERRLLVFDLVAGGSTVTGAGSSAGVGTASGVGASTSAQVGSSAGVGAASGIGASTANSVGSSSGTGAADGVGSSTGGSDGAGSASGTGTATGVGASTAASLGSTAGVGTASGIGASTAASVGSASGTGEALGVGTNGSVVSTGVGSASGTGTATGISPTVSRGGGKTTGSNLSRKQKKKLKAVESQEWLKAEETARQLLSDRFTKQTPQEKAQALETYIESLQPVIEALKALTSQIEEVVEEAPIIELTPHQEVIQRFDRLEKKVKSVEELIIILMADL